VAWLIPAISGLLAVGCAVAGILPVLRAKRVLEAHAERLSAALPVAVVDGARLRAALQRLDDSAAAAQAEFARMGGAARRIADGARDLRLREAVLALRLAGAALRAFRALL
jgi:hypothetical protein